MPAVFRLLWLSIANSNNEGLLKHYTYASVMPSMVVPKRKGPVPVTRRTKVLFIAGILCVAIVAAIYHSRDNLLAPLRETNSERINSKVLNEEAAGYFVFILSMGRYGNQMEHLLGVLGRIKATNRTLVLPPFVNYSSVPVPTFVPFDQVFKTSELRKYYPKIITMEHFMEQLAPTIWKEKVLYCMRSDKRCMDLTGSPKKPFWNHFNISTFDRSFTVGHACNDIYQLEAWKHPVVALSYPCAPYPMLPEHRHIARFFQWTDFYQKQARDILPPNAVTVAAHIRAGSDWVKACQKLEGNGMKDFMASPQCHEPNDSFKVTASICLPDTAAMSKQLSEIGSRVRQKGKTLILRIASDVPKMDDKLHLSQVYDEIVQVSNKDAFVDLAVLTMADYLVGNCVSSFTSFAARMRPQNTVEFFGVERP